jgi:hypothetical protein
LPVRPLFDVSMTLFDLIDTVLMLCHHDLPAVHFGGNISRR